MSEWRCPECGAANDGAASCCVVCDCAAPVAVAHSAEVPQPVMSAPVRPVRRRSPSADLARWRVAGVAAVVLAGLLGGGYLLIDAGAESAAETPPATAEFIPGAGEDTLPATGAGAFGTPSGSSPEFPEPAEPTLPTTSGLVSIAADAAADPRAAAIAALFDTYFTGINAHDASVATRVFAPGAVVDPADPEQVAEFGVDIATTRDSDVRLLAVADDPGSGEVIATVSFTSTQAPGYGPPERRNETCTDWRLDFRLTRWESELLILGTAPGAVSAPC